MNDNISQKERARKIIGWVSILLLIPAVICIGVWVFADRQYNLISIIIAILSCIPFFFRFESGKHGARELTSIAVMVAISVIGRLVFYALPGFKPVTAIVIITGIAFGAEAGFITGSLSALVSNMYFGQGPWTPFQMFVWGFVGFFAGLIFKNRKRPNRIILGIVGILGGVLYSLIMDIWTTLSATGEFNIDAYLLNIASSFTFMAIYAVSNVIFLQILAYPLLNKTDRVKVKYNIFR